LIELRALLAHVPDAPVAVAFDSAIWELGHSTHQPTRPVLAHRRGWRPPKALGVRLVTFEWQLPTRAERGLPVWQEATIVVAAAERPAAQGNWANVATFWINNQRFTRDRGVVAVGMAPDVPRLSHD
jgi:hypothetical protein